MVLFTLQQEMGKKFFSVNIIPSQMFVLNIQMAAILARDTAYHQLVPSHTFGVREPIQAGLVAFLGVLNSQNLIV